MKESNKNEKGFAGIVDGNLLHTLQVSFTKGERLTTSQALRFYGELYRLSHLIPSPLTTYKAPPIAVHKASLFKHYPDAYPVTVLFVGMMHLFYVVWDYVDERLFDKRNTSDCAQFSELLGWPVSGE